MGYFSSVCAPNTSGVFSAKNLFFFFFFVSSDHKILSCLKFQSCLRIKYDCLSLFLDQMIFDAVIILFFRLSDPKTTNFCNSPSVIIGEYKEKCSLQADLYNL